MDRIQKEDINCFIQEKLSRRYKFSNSFFSLSQIEEKCNSGELYVYIYDETVLLFENKNNFLNLYYYSNSMLWMNEIYKLDIPRGKTVVNIVQRNMVLPEGVLYKPYKIFGRLRRGIVTDEQGIKQENANFCEIKHSSELLQLMNSTFDMFVDHIPDEAELKKLIMSNSVICIKENENICGFVIFEDKLKTSYIRMVCVGEKYRRRGIGSRLMNMYFNIHRDMTGFSLWYDTTNQSARELYDKYGYREEKMYNLIYIF